MSTDQCFFPGRERVARPTVVQYVVPALIVFAFVLISAYAGALRALEVYFDPARDSIFLSNDYRPPNQRQ